MSWLITIAIILVVLWLAAELLGFVVGAALNLLWIAALVLAVLWIVGKLRGTT